MKIYCLILFSFLGINSMAQDSAAISHTGTIPYRKNSVTGTISAGFIDWHRQDFNLPAGFEKNNVSGYALFYGKLEYGVGENISIAAAAGYDAFVYNYSQLYSGYGGPVKRYKADHFRIFSGGLIGYYHLGKKIRVKNLDPFIGVGFYLNNIRHSELAQSDSTTKVSLQHNGTPYIKVGARYYITPKFSLFADVGYDQQSIFSVGMSIRSFSRKETKQ
ncbi:MAG: hypothetical protein JWQ38_169 [Flavipsychrobacter sp.]|nr:hypothetical protein [Flavipsychrobacter sp.]